MATLKGKSALLFLFAELLLSIASANHCKNHVAFTLDILILWCAFFVSSAFYASSCPSFLQVTTFHACRHASLPFFHSYGHCVVASLAFSDIDPLFLSLPPFTQFPALFATSYFGRSRHTYFFRRKVSASRIVSSTSALLPELFQKLFAVCSQPTKTFLLPR